MPVARAIRKGIEEPGPISYFVVAVSSALVVLAVAGYLARTADAGIDDLSAVATTRLQPAFAGGASGASPIMPVAAGRRQIVRASLFDGTLRPEQLSVQAGVPVTLLITGDEDCASSIAFTDLEVSAVADHQGTVEVQLPALVSGVYPFSCARGCASGLVLAE